MAAPAAADRPTHTLATFASTLDVDAVPAETVHSAKRLLLDTVGCMLGGASSSAGRIAAVWAARASDPHGASIISMPGRTTPALAANANGRFAAALDADEIFPSSRQAAHLAVATVSAALSIAEARRRPGRDLIAAVLAGYEVGARVSNSMVTGADGATRGLRAGWGPGSVLGATAAAGRAASLDPDRLAHAFGLAGMHVDPAPLKWTEVRPAPMSKSADGGWHAMAAVAAAELAELGMTGFDTILDGQTGLWKALGYGSCDFDSMVDALGGRWLIEDAVLKPWPCQYWMQQSITALWHLVEREDIQPETVDRVILATNRKSMSAKFHDIEPPAETDRAFSFPHVASMILMRIPPGPAWFDDDIFNNPLAGRLRERVEVRLHPDADRWPEWVVDHQIRQLPASATVVIGEKVWEHAVLLGRGAPWSPETRPSDDEVLEKFVSFAEPLYRGDPDWTGRLRAAVDWILDAEREPNVATLLDLLRPAVA